MWSDNDKQRKVILIFFQDKWFTILHARKHMYLLTTNISPPKVRGPKPNISAGQPIGNQMPL